MSAEQILIVEWICSGGNGKSVDSFHSKELLQQGRDMLRSTGTEFAAAGYNVVAPIDASLANIESFNFCESVITQDPSRLKQQILYLANSVDWILIIAPETDNLLVECVELLEPFRHKLLNPTLEFTSLTSNKHLTARYLEERKIPVPNGALLESELVATPNDGGNFVVKPVDGCGGDLVRFLDDPSFLRMFTERQFRIEEFIKGTPASVSAIGGKTPIVFSPLRQQLAGTLGPFVGCRDDLDSSQKKLATDLAWKTIEALPTTNGFFGIDMVIGPTPAVIEVNPRITMSFETLCKGGEFNLAAKMIENQIQFQNLNGFC